MDIQNKKIISIAIKHAYYKTEVPSGVSLEPDTDTAQLFQRLNSRWALRGNVAEWYVPAEFSLNDYLKANPETILKFAFNAADPIFLNYTALPFSSSEMMAFTNLDTEDDELTTVIIDKTIENTQLVAVELSLDELSGEKEEYTFVISLQSRSVAWRYYVINSREMDVQLSLSGNGSELFQAAGEKTLPDGNKAQLFTTYPNLIDLKQEPGIKPELSVSSSKGDLKIPLPIPELRMLKIEQEDNETVLYLDAYVFI